jgi:CDP-glucose 4,6-dehydratase
MKDVFWKNKKVAITGASGFIGSWLTERLVENSANVTILVKNNDPIGMDSIKHLTNNIDIIYGDVRNKDSVKKLIEGMDVIFHLAAITQVIYGKNNPVETFEVNAYGTLNLLEALRESVNNPFLVFSSTDKVYGEPKYLPIDEEHPLTGKSPYDASKLAAERLIYAYHITYGIKCSIARWSNTIGGKDSNYLRVAPDFIAAIMNGKSPVIRGNGKHIRDYMYVSDAVDGILSLAEKQKLTNGEVFNFGTEKPTSVVELAKLIIKIMGKEGKMEPVILNKPTVGEIDIQYLSAKKTKTKLKWCPNFNLKEGLTETIKWYQANLWWQNVIRRVKEFYKL